MNSRTRISSLTLAILATLFVFTPGLISADEFDVGGWDGGYSDVGGWDGGYSDVGGWDGGYSDVGGWDGGYSDVGGWDGRYSDVGGWDGGYSDVGGWDGGYSDVGGYSCCDSYDSYDYSYPTYDYGGSDYSYPTYDYGGTNYSYPRYNIGGSNYSYPRYSYGGSNAYSPPVVVSSGTRTVPSNTNVDVRNENNISNVNTNNNTNINNINVSATAVAVAPAPVAQPIAAYIPPPLAYHPAPFCTISISNLYGSLYGGQQTLTWHSTNTTSASINPHIGSVPGSGSRAVPNFAGQVYTMTVWGPGGTATCHTQATYSPPPPLPPTPYFPPIAAPTPYVSLTQIPYTGFDYGPVGNAMYWVSLALVASAGAYLTLYFRGGALAFAGSLVGRAAETRSARLAEFAPLPAAAFASPVRERREVSDSRIGTNDLMSFARSTTGAPEIVITRG